MFEIGTVTLGEVHVLNERAMKALGLPEEHIERTAKDIDGGDRAAPAPLTKRLARSWEAKRDPGGRQAFATVMTTWAAIESLRRWESRRLVLAVPVCNAQSAETLREEVDGLVCLEAPSL